MEKLDEQLIARHSALLKAYRRQDWASYFPAQKARFRTTFNASGRADPPAGPRRQG